jgi:cell wall-associated NlpC family hydrolase
MKVKDCLLTSSLGMARSVTVLLCVLFVAFGCGPKKIKVPEPLSGMRANVVRAAADLVGKPYKNGGRGPDSFDCSGLVYYAYKKAGVTLPVTAEEQGRSGEGISREAVLPGDLVVFKIKRDFHVGIMVNDREFLHASKSRGVAVDDLSLPYWVKSLQGFRSVL